MSEMVERVARAIALNQRDLDQAKAEKGGIDVCLAVDGYMSWARDIARAAIEAMDCNWRSMNNAPTDGTVIEVVGRYPEATAGFPQYVGFHDGKWWHHSKHEPLEVIPWAWRSRTDWPDEHATLNEEG